MSEPIRVAVFGLRGLDGVEGGIETHGRELYPRLAALGYDVTVLTRPRHDARPSCSSTQCRTKVIWAPRGKGMETFLHSLLCACYCMVTRPDIVHIHAIAPGVFAILLRIARLPVVLTHHGQDYDATKWGWLARSMLRLGEWIGVRFANETICVSDALRSSVEARHGVRCRTIYNGAHLNPDTTVIPTLPQLRALAAGRYVLMVGRITSHKRILDVAAAMACDGLKDLPLVICGSIESSDPNIAAVKKAAAEQPNILLPGFVEPRELPWLYSRALCTVMASSYEGMPFAVLEALAAGSAMLLSDIGAHRELGLPADRYFPVGDVPQIRARLLRLQRGRQAGQRRFAPVLLDARFEWTIIAQKTAAVFAQALTGRSETAPSATTSPTGYNNVGGE